MNHKIFKYDPKLKAFEADFDLRKANFENKKAQLLQNVPSLAAFANGHLYYGFHRTEVGWYYREWAPAADAMYLSGDFCGWDRHASP